MTQTQLVTLRDESDHTVGLLNVLAAETSRHGIFLSTDVMHTKLWPIMGGCVVRVGNGRIPLVEYLNCYSEQGDVANTSPEGIHTVRNVKIRAYGTRYRGGESER